VLHLRIITPPDRTGRVERLLLESPAAIHVVVLPGAARSPAGDLITCDVVREGTSEIIECLRELDIERDGSVMLERVDATLMLLGERPLTSFIWQPDALSWVVGFLAGVAGMLSLTSAKAGTLVGVLISVTTVPAAANVAVALAYGVGEEASGSALQLVINVAAIVAAGVLTLLVQRLVWPRLRRRPQS
jgi:hypothetical protein